MPRIIIALCAALPAVAGASEDPPGCPPGGTDLRWETFARPLLTTRCVPCHDWTRYSRVYMSRSGILLETWNGWMPMGDTLSREDRDRLAEWIACDLPFDGPSCPPKGTASGWSGFARGFLAGNCGGCHASNLSGAARNGAPAGLDWDDRSTVAAHGGAIAQRLERGQMPPASWVAPEEADRLVEWLACGAPAEAAGAPYRRGDPDDDGMLDLSDALSILGSLFLGSGAPPCPDAADVDGDGSLEITDAIRILTFLFLGGEPPPGAFGPCATALVLGCGSFESCPEN